MKGCTGMNRLRSSVCLRTGAFHACCIFLSVNEKCFGYAGYRDIIIEIGFVGLRTTEQVFNSKHCNHGIRVIKTVFEVLLRLKFQVFCDWMESQCQTQVVTEFKCSDKLEVFIDSIIPYSISLLWRYLPK